MAQPQRQAPSSRQPLGAVPGSAPGPRRPDPGKHEQTRRPAQRPALRPWGTFPGRTGVLLVISGTAAGAAATVLACRGPGLVLGVFLIAATAAAALAVRPQAVRLIIPAPALAYFVAAVIAGLIHDGAAGTSGTALVISAVQSVASGFLAMTIATVLAIAITAARWRQIPGHSPRPGRPPATSPAAEGSPAARQPIDAGHQRPGG